MPSSQTPTPEELAAIAAKLDPKLSPDVAIARARALLEAAKRAARATQIADEEEEKRLMAEAERLSKIGLNLWDEEISISDAFNVATEIAARLKVPPYKTENGFLNALRKAKLTIERVYTTIEQERRESAESDVLIKEPETKWEAAKLAMEELNARASAFRRVEEETPSETPELTSRELTSVKAVEELFKQKAQRINERDRKRKAASKPAAAKNASKEISENLSRKSESKKRNLKAEKRNSIVEKRKRASK